MRCGSSSILVHALQVDAQGVIRKFPREAHCVYVTVSVGTIVTYSVV